MPDVVSGTTTFPIAPRQTPIELEISAYYSESSGKLSAKAVRDPQYAATNVDIHSVCFLFPASQDRENDQLA